MSTETVTPAPMPTEQQYKKALRDAAERGITERGDRAAAQLAQWQAEVNHGHKSRGEKIESLARELGECSPGCAHCHTAASALLERAEIAKHHRGGAP